MNLHVEKDKIYIGVSFDLASFPEMIKSHGDDFQDTLEIEERYKYLIDTPITNFDSISNYIKEVCRWGNYPGVSGKVLKNNSKEKILAVFEDVRTILKNDNPDLAMALSRVNTLYGLGTPSFASKHLRFILPEMCPVYDRILTSVLPYSFDPTGYFQFAKDCQSISNQLCTKRIQNPIRDAIVWYASDVEAAIFSQYYD